ncbi:CehA/McbA family metallohydrolase [Kordiimonas pumila]|uniref:CehA/McbA family metallohydrolase n=1 Tax=Kordiimonas pumila TaxID=2161677 RepID=A0ABV7D4K9_9PROT|nr:CehA/McbA family metallohydrolase [Kordiimonas pumila]
MIRRRNILWSIAAVCSLITSPVAAEPTRVPVLAGVAHPHSYYWREMYMPQLTSGPSAASFSPDGQSLIYTMQGSLWRQKIGDDTAYQLTAGPGYDYQPDWSPDGNYVVFTRQQHNALNLMVFDVQAGSVRALTEGTDVNLEPRFSPDGKQIVYVSSRDSGYLGIYIAGFTGTALAGDRPLVAGRVSDTYRYYYSQADHAVNPSWSPDGKTVYYVSNQEIAWGTGNIWAVAASGEGTPKLVLEEETTWATRPQIDHGGKRMIYSSYSGRQWHQLWIATAEGKYPLPLTFGDFDIWQTRFSPDDTHLVYSSNEAGGLNLIYHTFVGGERQQIKAKNRVYKQPVVPVEISLKDGKGKPLASRVSVLAADGRHYGPDNSRMHGDDFVDAAQADHETHYFHCDQQCTVMVPVGEIELTASHGYDYKLAASTVTVKAARTVELVLAENSLPQKFGQFTSADMHVHMNYGGKYKQTAATMAADARAENLDIIYNLIVNKEERIPDISEFSTDVKQIDGVTIYEGQEYHSSYWGHMGLLHLGDHYLTPDFTSYWHTGLASAYPTNGIIEDLAHKQGAVTGYVHPFDGVPDPAASGKLTHSLPVGVALGKTDYLEVVSFANHEDTAAVWYKFLNLGFRLSAGAGTDAMTNYASLRGPIGLNRMFLDGVQADKPATLKKAIKGGHGFVTNGPLVGLLVNKVKPGGSLALPANGSTVKIQAALRSPVPVEAFELVMNGVVVATFETDADKTSADITLDLPVTKSGWVLVRAVSKTSHPFVQDIFTYATTNPVWLEVEGKPHHAPADAAYFTAWLDRAAEHAGARDDYNHTWEREAVLAEIAAARKVYEHLAEGTAP